MISVIIPAYNASATLAACLAALQHQTLAQTDYEIIVVDDGSTDDTAVIAQNAGVCLLKNAQNKGAAAARNLGITQAVGDILCFTDADCVPCETWLAEMTRPFTKDPEIVGVKGIYTSQQPQIVARFVQIEYEDKYDLMAGQPVIDFIDTYSAAYRQQVFTDLGGFDETISYVEDQEFSFRVAKQGSKMVFQPTAVVSHQHSNSLSKYVRKKFWIGYWKARFIRRYPDRAVKDSHTPQVLKLQMGLAALILIFLLTTLVFPPSSILLGAMILLFFITTIPFIKKAWAKDKTIGFVSPFLLLIRAFALGFGFAFGSISRRSDA